MTLQSSGTIYMSQIASEFYGRFGSYVYNLNSYRGQTWYTGPVNGTISSFSTGTLYMSHFYGTAVNCACDCADCANCGGACGNGGS